MTPLLFLILPLCIGSNCDYSWTQIEDRTEFESLYNGGLEPNLVGAFMANKIIYFYDIDTTTILHEIAHIHCSLNNPSQDTITYCNVRLDMADIAVKANAVTPDSVSSPEITQRMAFQELLYSNKEYGQ